MSLTGTRVLVVAVTTILVAAFAVVAALLIADWERRGWAGFAYQVDAPEGVGADSLGPFSDDLGRVAMVAPGSPAARTGIAVGDRVVSINGVPVDDVSALRDLSHQLTRGDRVVYELERDGEPVRQELVLGSQLGSPLVLMQTVTSAVVAVVFLAISVLVAWNRPRSRPGLVFFLLASAGAAVYFLGSLLALEFPSLRGILAMGVDLRSLMVLVGAVIVGLVMGNLLLHLALVFPKTRPVLERWPRAVPWLHLLPFLPYATGVAVFACGALARATSPWPVVVGAGLAASACLAWLARLARREGVLRAAADHPFLVAGSVLLVSAAAGRPLLDALSDRSFLVGAIVGIAGFGWFILVAVVYAVLTCIALARSYREADADEKRQVRWPLWGTLVAVGGSALLTVVALGVSWVTDNRSDTGFMAVSALAVMGQALYVLIPLSFAFGILKYRLMDIDVVIRKTVVYAGMTVFVLVTYLLVVGVVGVTLVSAVHLEDTVLTVVATLIVAGLFVPVRNTLQRVVERRMLRGRRTLDEARQAVAGAVVEADSLDPLLSDIAEHVHTALQTRTLALLVRPPEGEALEGRVTLGLPDSAVDRLWVASSHDALQSGGRVLRDPDRLDGLAAARPFIAGVARLKGAPVALLALGSRLTAEPYGEDEEAFLEAVADQLGLAVGKLQRRREEIEATQAREIQRSLLPRSLPRPAGVDIAALWRPAREVSGDAYDALDLGDDAVALTIGDVAGKGMPAALLMSSLQAATRAVAAADISPDQVCRRIRTVVCGNLTGGRFVTFFYALLQPTRRQLHYCNAGHNAPLLLRADGTVQRLERGGPAFARVLTDGDYTSSVVDLQPGDRLLLFTDGAVEAADESGEIFGDDRLVAAARSATGGAESLAAAVAEAVGAFRSGPPGDDLTLVAIVVR